jgi:hypothetical protein
VLNSQPLREQLLLRAVTEIDAEPLLYAGSHFCPGSHSYSGRKLHGCLFYNDHFAAILADKYGRDHDQTLNDHLRVLINSEQIKSVV